eukprot:gb/GECG01008439.1/.p1 GENE.gb/GECG01008439.1/~~gb/GECG01008439.1/.p1  ORF type:complete len:608 (+),score=60.66 gb/GECG01008439.1/:1-1824(+)
MEGMTQHRGFRVVVVFIFAFVMVVTVEASTSSSSHRDQFPMRIQYPREPYLDAKHAYDSLLEHRRPEMGCFSRALQHVSSESCEQMSDQEQRKLGLALANCHFEATGRQTFPCDAQQGSFSTKECISGMSETAYIIFTQFFQQAVQLCIYIRAESWTQEVQKTIDELSQSSAFMNSLLLDQLNAQEAILYQTNVSIANQESLIELQGEAKRTLWGSIESILIRIDSFDGAFQRLDDVTESLRRIYSRMSGNIAGIYSLGYYVVASLVVWIVTSSHSTKSARSPLMILLVAALSIEVSIQYAWTHLCSKTPYVAEIQTFSATWVLKAICQLDSTPWGVHSASTLAPIHFGLKIQPPSALLFTKVADFTLSLEYCQESLRWSCTCVCILWWIVTSLLYKDPSKAIDDKLETIRHEQEIMKRDQRYIRQLLEQPRRFHKTRYSDVLRDEAKWEPAKFGIPHSPDDHRYQPRFAVEDPEDKVRFHNSSNFGSPVFDRKGHVSNFVASGNRASPNPSLFTRSSNPDRKDDKTSSAKKKRSRDPRESKATIECSPLPDNQWNAQNEDKGSKTKRRRHNRHDSTKSSTLQRKRPSETAVVTRRQKRQRSSTDAR